MLSLNDDDDDDDDEKGEGDKTTVTNGIRSTPELDVLAPFCI